MSEPKAIAILIDNSSTSINGDYFQNRLDAQRNAAVLLADYHFSAHRESQISIFTTGSKEHGIRTSFTSSNQRISESLQSITCGGSVALNKCIRAAILAFHHLDYPNASKHILCFVGGPHDITQPIADDLAKLLESESIIGSFFIFGSNIPGLDTLKSIVKQNKKSVFEVLSPNGIVVSDSVLGSELGPGKDNSKVKIDEIGKIDPFLANELRHSYHHICMNNAGIIPQIPSEAAKSSKKSKQKGPHGATRKTQKKDP